MQKPKTLLKTFWGYDAFRGAQEAIIAAVLAKKEVLALMPTGGGKSLCYQVPALVLEGICIVISPLVALIQDQVRQLKARGIKAIALTGGISFSELNALLDNAVYGDYKFLYLSPERLQQPLVQQRIREMAVNLIAIDEAHCVSQWGHDFRPAYLECALLREWAPNAPIIALTATATPRVVEDIVTHLKLQSVCMFKDSFARTNLIFKVKHTQDKRYQLQKYIHQYPGSAIVYVRSRKICQSLANFLNRNGCKASYFHGGLSRTAKEDTLNLWLQNEVDVMVATNAFGMGIDKPDVRLVVHYQIPDSLESYFQEAGRAGRDGQTANAVFLTTEADKVQAQRQFLAALPDVGFVKRLYVQLNTYFQIPYGERPTETFTLPFNAFCTRYDFPVNKAYSAFRLLDQHSVVALSENFTEKTTLQFVAPNSQLFSYMNKNRKVTPVIQTLLRTYGGITEHETKIDLHRISKKTGEKELFLKEILEQLARDGLVTYKKTSSDLEITFLVPREDARTINVFAEKIKHLNTVKQNNMNAVLAYVNNAKTCRSVFLLNYFGETARKPCGTCDICMQQHQEPPGVLKDRIIALLQASPHTSRRLEQRIGAEEQLLLQTLQRLLEDEVVYLNYKNEYSIKTQ